MPAAKTVDLYVSTDGRYEKCGESKSLYDMI